MERKTVVRVAALFAAITGWLGLAPAVGAAEPERIRQLERLVFVGDDAGALRKLSIAGRGYLGIETQAINEALRDHFGAPKDAGLLISGVEADSPAASAGLEVGDVLVSIAGEKLASALDVLGAVRPHKEGDRVEVVVVRDGRERTLSATLAERDRKAIDLGHAFEWKEEDGPGRRHLRFRREGGEGGGEEKDVDILITPEIRLERLEGLQDRLNSIDWSKIQCPRDDARERLEKRIEALEKRLQEMRERLDRVGERR